MPTSLADADNAGWKVRLKFDLHFPAALTWSQPLKFMKQPMRATCHFYFRKTFGLIKRAFHPLNSSPRVAYHLL